MAMEDVARQNPPPPATAAEASSAGGAAVDSTSLFLQILEHPDGSISRPFVPDVPIPSAFADDASVLFKDAPLNPANGTWLRLYRPNPLPYGEKLPVIVFFHGGGFVLFGPATFFNHAFCEAMAGAVRILIVSLDYRLAPEHRLPAACDDAVEALHWVRAQAQPPANEAESWLAAHGDFGRCFLMGTSSGGNIAYHAALRTAVPPVLEQLHPLELAGVILHQPYFGGVERTPSEARSEEDFMLPLRANDTLWRLSLPEGADRDHELANPLKEAAASGGRRKWPELVKSVPRWLVTGNTGDPLVDRQMELVKRMEEEGAKVTVRIKDEGFHAIELFEASAADGLFADIREFIGAA